MPNDNVVKTPDSRKNKRKIKFAAKASRQLELKSSEFVCSQQVTARKDDSDGTDQNEKVRRILEDKPSQHNDSTVVVKAQSLHLLAADPAVGSQGETQIMFAGKQSRRSQRASADVTSRVGTIPIDKSFLMQDPVTARTNNQPRGITQSAKSEHNRKRKISNHVASNMAQENRTSHSEEDEPNLQPQNNVQLQAEFDLNKLAEN
jgi:hypothetical protein